MPSSEGSQRMTVGRGLDAGDTRHDCQLLLLDGDEWEESRLTLHTPYSLAPDASSMIFSFTAGDSTCHAATSLRKVKSSRHVSDRPRQHASQAARIKRLPSFET